MFAIPALFGLGDFWYLSDEEEKEASDVSWMLVGSLSKSNRKKFENWASYYLPILMYCAIVGTIAGKRIKQTYEEMQKRKPQGKLFSVQGRNRNEQGQEFVNGSADSGEYADETSDSGIVGKTRILSDPISEAFGRNSH